jgi:hypothetical protein
MSKIVWLIDKKDKNRYYALPNSINLSTASEMDKTEKCQRCKLDVTNHPHLFHSQNGHEESWIKLCTVQLLKIDKDIGLKNFLFQTNGTLDLEKVPSEKSRVPIEVFRIKWRDGNKIAVFTDSSADPYTLLQRKGIAETSVILIEHMVGGDERKFEKWIPPAPDEIPRGQLEEIPEPENEEPTEKIESKYGSGEMIEGGRFFPFSTIKEEGLEPKVREKFKSHYILIMGPDNKTWHFGEAELEWYRPGKGGWWAKIVPGSERV